MKTFIQRLLVLCAISLITFPVLAFAGFRLWLAQQPEDFRAQIEQYSTIEFLGLVKNAVFPSPVIDRAGFDRRPHLGRGHSPWVMRSSLDGRPRILAVALAPELWLAYSTETASIHQFWNGDIDYTGPVYDARHGREPTSRGSAYLRAPLETAWRIQQEGEWKPAEIQWRGHGFSPDGNALWIRFDVFAPDGPKRTITEWPEREITVELPGATLTRRFEITDGPPVALIVNDATLTPATTTGLTKRDDLYIFSPKIKNASIRRDFAGAMVDLAPPDQITSAASLFADYDCSTCHSTRERIVGPAWSEIALRETGSNRDIATKMLAIRIREGSKGRWGEAEMPAHPDISLAVAATLARSILDTPPADAPTSSAKTDGAEATWSFRGDSLAPPESLHPSLRSHEIKSPDFTPLVGGLAWLPDGRLGVSTWDPDGAVFAIDGWADPKASPNIVRIAEGLHEPLGLAVVDDGIYVMQKHEVTRLLDHNGDDWIDEYRTVANDWPVTSNFHEFGFGLEAWDGALYGSLSACVLNGGKSCREQTSSRGRVFRVALDEDENRPNAIEYLASGFRTPNGLGFSPDGELFVTDNQGDWLPSSKLIHVEKGRHYGWRGPGVKIPDEEVSPPALWLPQSEIGNSPTDPLFLTRGPYQGQVIFGDIYNGGLKRAALERIDDTMQGAAFHFSGGLLGPVNRLLAKPEGDGFVVGQIGSHGNWGEPDKRHFGIEVVDMGEDKAFEPLRMSIQSDGFEIEFTRPLAKGFELAGSDIVLRDWFYIPSQIYGGPKYDLRDLPITHVRLSEDRKQLRLVVPDLKMDRIVYLRLPESIRSESGETLWVREAWYTVNAIPPNDASSDLKDGLPATANQLSEEERKMGWRLLFGGKNFEGWKIYGAEDDATPYWEIDDEAFHFTRDVSLAGLIWNHINPFTPGAIDLMTREKFSDFELAIDWRISAGGNSGIFYLVPNEESSLSWDYAVEMQVLDDDAHPDGQIDLHRAGDLYDLQSFAQAAARPVGEWNTARIRVEGERLQHWLNDVPLADIVRGSPAWDEAVAASKFDGTEGFGRARSGHIVLQDHGDPVWFRNIKIREIGK